jgi:acyl-CoA thioesterase YciA
MTDNQLTPTHAGETAVSDGRQAPGGELALRMRVTAADIGPAGPVHGRRIVSLMEAAGAMTAARQAGGRVTTLSPGSVEVARSGVRAGDVVCCYTRAAPGGDDVVDVHVEVWIAREAEAAPVRVARAEFSFVAVDDAGRPRRLELAPPPFPP